MTDTTTGATTSAETRVERDSLGELRVPTSAYYGVQTMRAKENFPISDLRFPRQFIRALGQIKGAAARVNMDLGLLDATPGNAIVARHGGNRGWRARRSVRARHLSDRFRHLHEHERE